MGGGGGCYDEFSTAEKEGGGGEKRMIKRKENRRDIFATGGGICLFRWPGAALCLNRRLSNFTFEPVPRLRCHFGIETLFVYIGRSSDFRYGFVCPQSFGRGTSELGGAQRRDSAVAKPLARNFVDAIPRRQALHICTLRPGYRFSRCIVSRFLPRPETSLLVAYAISMIYLVDERIR